MQLVGMAGLGAGAVTVAGCQRADEPEPAPSEPGTPAPPPEPTGPVGTITVVQGVDVESLDPHQTTSIASRSIITGMFDKLVERSYEMELVPGLAASWQLLDDVTWEFQLRQGVNFHNGEPFNAEAAKYSIERLLAPETANIYAAQFGPVEEIEAVGDYTLRIHTSEPLAGMLDALTILDIVPPGAIEAGTLDFNRTTVGTGPYVLKEWVPAEYLVMEAADQHFTRPATLQQVTWKPVSEAFTRVTLLKTGEADIIAPVTPLQVAEIEDAGHTVLTVTGAPVQYIAFNINREYFKDPRVRQALNHAVDVESIIKTILGGYAQRLRGPFGPGTLAYDESLPPYEYDPRKARELLAAAGYPDGFEVTLSSPQGRYLNDMEVCETIAGQWAEVGVRTSVQVYEWGTYVQGILGKTHDCFLMQHGGVPEDNATQVHLSGRIQGAAWQGYSNPEVDRLIDEAPQTMDPVQRQQKYQELSRLVRDDAPWVFLYNQMSLFGVNDRVLGFEPDPLGRVMIDTVTVK